MKGFLFDIGENVIDPSARLLQSEPAIRIANPLPTPAARREVTVLLFVQKHGQAKILQVIAALQPPSGLPCALHCGKQQPDKNANDRNDHKQFNQRKPAFLRMRRALSLPVTSHGSFHRESKMEDGCFAAFNRVIPFKSSDPKAGDK